jgi:NAD(P)-dependent dehydrogenase (short-subunit alcohol dehydrogenase family)
VFDLLPHGLDLLREFGGIGGDVDGAAAGALGLPAHRGKRGHIAAVDRSNGACREDVLCFAWRATFLTIKSFLPGMKQRKRGAVVTISSAAARRPHPGSPIPYAAAKAGIIIVTQDLAAQVGPHNIRANCIAPETILTEGNRERIPQALQTMLAESHPP